MKGQAYIGTKIVMARLASRHEVKRELGESTESFKDEAGYRVEYEGGYISWSPKDVFERSYREITQSEISMINS